MSGRLNLQLHQGIALAIHIFDNGPIGLVRAFTDNQYQFIDMVVVWAGGTRMDIGQLIEH